MHNLKLTVMSLRYSSWSMRAFLALRHAGAELELETVSFGPQDETPHELRGQRSEQTTTGMVPVLEVDGTRIHESLAICEWAAEAYPQAALWPEPPLQRALARSAACEMATGFFKLRAELPCHVFARVPGFQPSAAAAAEIERVQDLWSEALQRSGGPFLFGAFGIVDAMYFPVATRFVTYGVQLPDHLHRYSVQLHQHPAAQALLELARGAPQVDRYDKYVRSLGGVLP